MLCAHIEDGHPNREGRLAYGGRGLAWFRTQAFQACNPGFKSRRPHQPFDSVPRPIYFVDEVVMSTHRIRLGETSKAYLHH
jgi:hypothetical protein